MIPGSVEARARLSEGKSLDAVYRMVAAALESRRAGGVLADVGCGSGGLRPFLRGRFQRYIGVDAVPYEGYPADAEFLACDLDASPLPLPDGAADAVAAVETIEHLENPRALMRELARVCKPGGWVAVTTPNQLSLLSLTTLIVKGRFSHFQDVNYPAHITALLECDLRRIAQECGLQDAAILYSLQGRLVFTPRHYPSWLSRLCPRAFSDNVLLIGRKPS